MIRPRFILTVLLWLSWPVIGAASEAASSTFYPRTVQSDAGHALSLTPDTEPVTVTAHRQWQLQAADDEQIVIETVQLTLPQAGITRPLTVSRAQGGWHLGQITLDQVGVWLLDIKFTSAGDPDRAQFKLAIDHTPFSVSTTPDSNQVALIKTLALPLTQTPTEPAASEDQAALGHALFFDPNLSRDGATSCASCHVPALAFTDGKARSRIGSRNAPSLIGIAQKRWFNRDGSKDSLWSQALGPIERANELGLDRVSLLQRIANSSQLRDAYAASFVVGLDPDWLASLPAASPLGDATAQRNWAALPDRDKLTVNAHFTNVGHALAAYQSKLVAQPSAFDRYAHALNNGETDTSSHLSASAQRGLMLFIGSRAQCINCHAGPSFSNGQFHNIGTAPIGEISADPGRRAGIEVLRSDPFNCAGDHSVNTTACTHLERLGQVEIPYLLQGAFLTPGLRNVARTGPWFHDGSAESLEAVLTHYRQPPASRSGRTEHELAPLALSDEDISHIIAFLESLTGEPSDSKWFTAPHTP